MNQLRLSVAEAHIPYGNITYCHSKRECASSAFELNEKTAKINIRIPMSLAAEVITLEIYDEALTAKVNSVKGEWVEREEAFDIYTFDISLSDLQVGLYFYRFCVNSLLGNTYSHKLGETVMFNENSDIYGMLQITVCDFKHLEPKSIYGGTIYHIFVDRFNRGGEVNVPEYLNRIDGKWENIPEYPAYHHFLFLTLTHIQASVNEFFIV